MVGHRDPRLDITYWSREEPFGWKYRCWKYRQSHPDGKKKQMQEIQIFQIDIAIVKIVSKGHQLIVRILHYGVVFAKLSVSLIKS